MLWCTFLQGWIFNLRLIFLQGWIFNSRLIFLQGWIFNLKSIFLDNQSEYCCTKKSKFTTFQKVPGWGLNRNIHPCVFVSSCNGEYTFFGRIHRRRRLPPPPVPQLQIRLFKSRWIRIHSKVDGSGRWICRWQILPLQKWLFILPPFLLLYHAAARNFYWAQG